MDWPQAVAEILATLRPSAEFGLGDGFDPISESGFTDGYGHFWTRRGGRLTKLREVRRLFLDTDTRVVLCLWPDVLDVPATERERFWANIESGSDNFGTTRARYWAAEFRDADRHKLLVIEIYS